MFTINHGEEKIIRKFVRYISSENLLPVAILKSSMHYIARSDATVLGPQAAIIFKL